MKTTSVTYRIRNRDQTHRSDHPFKHPPSPTPRKKNNETKKCRKSEEKCAPKYIAYSPQLTWTPALSLMTVVRWRLAKPDIVTVIPLNRSSGGNFPYVL